MLDSVEPTCCTGRAPRAGEQERRWAVRESVSPSWSLGRAGLKKGVALSAR
jgi:hypothetical protein